jgi:hypothetical protein
MRKNRYKLTDMQRVRHIPDAIERGDLESVKNYIEHRGLFFYIYKRIWNNKLRKVKMNIYFYYAVKSRQPAITLYLLELGLLKEIKTKKGYNLILTDEDIEFIEQMYNKKIIYDKL